MRNKSYLGPNSKFKKEGEKHLCRAQMYCMRLSPQHGNDGKCMHACQKLLELLQLSLLHACITHYIDHTSQIYHRSHITHKLLLHPPSLPQPPPAVQSPDPPAPPSPPHLPPTHHQLRRCCTPWAPKRPKASPTVVTRSPLPASACPTCTPPASSRVSTTAQTSGHPATALWTCCTPHAPSCGSRAEVRQCSALGGPQGWVSGLRGGGSGLSVGVRAGGWGVRA